MLKYIFLLINHARKILIKKKKDWTEKNNKSKGNHCLYVVKKIKIKYKCKAEVPSKI